MAFCGGVSCIIEPRVFVALSKAKMISPDGTSKPFSNRADGYGRGEGCGVVLLKPLKRVRTRRTRCLELLEHVAKTQSVLEGFDVRLVTEFEVTFKHTIQISQQQLQAHDTQPRHVSSTYVILVLGDTSLIYIVSKSFFVFVIHRCSQMSFQSFG